MGQSYLIDTNVIIDYTSGLLPEAGSAFAERIFDDEFNTSVVVKIETLGYKAEPSKMQQLETFLATANIYALDSAVTNKTIELRRIKKMKLGDAIIAATTLVHGFILVSRNVSDFRNLPGLQVISLYDL